MKKALIGILTLTMVLSMAGCSKEQPKKESSSSASSSSEASSSASSSSASSSSAQQSTDGVDISNAIDASATSKTSPAALNQWVKIEKYSVETKKNHPIYVRVTKSTTNTQDATYVANAIEQHNKYAYDFKKIDVSSLKLPSDVELAVLDYDIYVPSDFPTSSEIEGYFGEPTLKFGVANVDQDGFPSADGTSTYLGLGTSSEDLSTQEKPKYSVGNMYSFKSLYKMVKGFENYVFQEFYTSSETNKLVYVYIAPR